MAKSHTNAKSSHYHTDKDAFLKDLKQFNDSKNIPFKTPTVNGIEIDLYQFYTLVQQRGGLSKVNQNDTWDTLLRPLRLPSPCINGSTLLRKIYGMYLEKYERAKGPPGRDDDNDLDEDPRRGRGGGMPRITFGGGTYISASGEALRTGSRVGGPSERLALSLLSPMPNEQDFAVNVCTVLAADHSNRLPLSTTPHILDFLLAHAGVYNHSNLRDTIGRSYFEARGRYPDEFWQLRAGGGGAKELADETKFMQMATDQPELMVQALAAHNTLTDCLALEGPEEDDDDKVIAIEEPLEDWVTEPSEEDQLFAPEMPGGSSCVYTQRVLQIASIVRSLSFHEENVQLLAKNNTLIRFLLLCANSWVGALRQSGLDTLGNISMELIIKEPATCLISRHVLSTIQSALVSQDRARVLAALELLNKLAQNEQNEDALLRALEEKVYSDVCALLTLRDIMLLVCTLECVYALTSLGDRASEAVARVPGLVHTLVSLVTVEAQSYGPRACILMRVVETVSGPNAAAAAERERESAMAAAATSERHAPPPTQAPPPPSASPVRPVTSQSPAPPPAPPSPSASPAPAPAPMSSIQMSHQQQKTIQENEHFAQAWLRNSYEPLPPNDNSPCDVAEVYRQYLACCKKLQRQGVIAPAHFPRLVRSVFGGTVGPNMVSTATGSAPAYIGIRAKAQPTKTTTQGPASPILKAQLTNKPSGVEAKPVVTQAQPQPQQASTHPHLSQALESTPTNTSLIKHLLAHKVSPAPIAPQVAQRQQNQQRVVPAGTVVIQPPVQGTPLELDPEALIKCTTITPGGVASSAPNPVEKIVIAAPEEIVMKEEPVQIQIDEQSQLTIKSAQNKMLADLLEKKSNPPVQVVQMGQQINAPTIQITETGQIVQVKQDNPVIQIAADSPMVSQPMFSLKNEMGQIIQIKGEHLGIIQFKNEQGQIVQIKNEGQTVERGKLVPNSMVLELKDKERKEKFKEDPGYPDPPSKKAKIDDNREEESPKESVSKTAANLYAALAASTLEDEEELMMPPPKQEPLDVIQPSVLVTGAGDNASVIIQEPMLQQTKPVQQPTIQMSQGTLQVQQPTLQVQTPTLQVQQPTLQVQQPMLQVQPMDVQNIIASQAGQIILQEKPIVSQQQFVQQPMQFIASPSTSQGGLSYITQNLPGNMMQKTIIIVQGTGGGPLTLTVNNPGGLDEATLNSLITQATEAITQQQIIQNSGVIQSAQRVVVSQPTLTSSQPITVVKAQMPQNAPQLTQSQQPIITAQPQPHKAILNQSQPQIMVTQKQPPALISTATNQIVAGNQQVIQTGQSLMQGNQQIIAVSNNQQIIVNAPLKPGVHRVVQQPQRPQIITQSITQPTIVQTDAKTSVIQTNTVVKPQQPVMRQVITRQPVMVGNTKIGEKETVVNQPVTPEPPAPRTPTPVPTPAAVQPPQLPAALAPQDETPWICHWRGCNKSFENASEVFAHAAKTHCPPVAGGEAPCMWLDCDRVPRKTFALLNHLTDKHCNVHALKALFASRRHTAAEAEAAKPVSVGYPPNAAIAALNKHATDVYNPRELMTKPGPEAGRTLPHHLDENEGPVTKSIRLTAALILRNIVIYSNTGRRQLRSYEAHLAAIALSTVEASRTIAQVLYDMNNI